MVTIGFGGTRIAAHDPALVARFWGRLLGWRPETGGGGAITLVPDTGRDYPIIVEPEDTQKVGQDTIHFDLTTSSAADFDRAIARALALGGSRADIGQGDEDPHEVLADPEGHAFCIIEPGNRFLADTGAVGAMNCDGGSAGGDRDPGSAGRFRRPFGHQAHLERLAADATSRSRDALPRPDRASGRRPRRDSGRADVPGSHARPGTPCPGRRGPTLGSWRGLAGRPRRQRVPGPRAGLTGRAQH